DKLVPGPEVIPSARLVAVIKFDRQIRGGVRPQNGGRAVFHSPNNAVVGFIGGGAPGRPRILGTLRSVRGKVQQPRIFEWKCQHRMANRPVIKRSIEIRGRSKHTAGQGAAELLINGEVIGGIEFSHIRAVDEVEVAIFAAAYGKVTRYALRIHHVWQN